MYLLDLDIFYCGYCSSSLHHIERKIEESPATLVILLSPKRTNQQVCLKVWKPLKDDLYDTVDQERRISYLLEGFKFNQQFASRVYLGLVPLYSQEEFAENASILLGQLIKKPTRDISKMGIEYALVMKYLDEDQRLDKQLTLEYGTPRGMKFLAKKIAKMHKKIAKKYRGLEVPRLFDNPASLSKKLDLNESCYKEALQKMRDAQQDTQKYNNFTSVLRHTLDVFESLFQQRYDKGHIMRCHGDLKSTNLWIYSKKLSFMKSRQLLMLDCIDFKDEFCYIDTLSDVAMLAVDIERILVSCTEKNDEKTFSAQLNVAQLFLSLYLREMKEDYEKVWPVLEYYMVEKALVCAFISILYDNNITLCFEYCEIALLHAERLEKLLRSSLTLASEWLILSNDTQSTINHSG